MKSVEVFDSTGVRSWGFGHLSESRAPRLTLGISLSEGDRYLLVDDDGVRRTFDVISVADGGHVIRFVDGP